MQHSVHLIDGTYELFRHYYALPGSTNADGEEIAATRGVCGSLMGLLESGATHLAVATDHVIESFRNDLWPGYKDGSGIDPDLFAQFGPLEDALEAMGIPVWRMIEHEADDGLASGAAMAARDERVERVLICTPDKDLAQCVEGRRVVQFDRRKRETIDERGVVDKFGVPPVSIPDFLALMGDTADGYPGLEGWGRKSASVVLARYGHIEMIPAEPEAWDVEVRGKARLAATLVRDRERALLFREVATVVRDAPVSSSVDELRWPGPRDDFAEIAERMRAPGLDRRARALAGQRVGPLK